MLYLPKFSTSYLYQLKCHFFRDGTQDSYTIFSSPFIWAPTVSPFITFCISQLWLPHTHIKKKKYHKVGVLNNSHLFLTVLEMGSPTKIKVWLIQFLVKFFFLAWREPPSHCALTWQGDREREKERERLREDSGPSSSSYEDTNPIMRAPLS